MGVVLGEGRYFRNKNFTQMWEIEKKSKSQKISASYLFLNNNYPKKTTFPKNEPHQRQNLKSEQKIRGFLGMLNLKINLVFHQT